MLLSIRQIVKQSGLLRLSEEFIDKVWEDLSKEIVLAYNEKKNIFNLRKLDLTGGYRKKFIISTKDFLNNPFKGKDFPPREFYVNLFTFSDERAAGQYVPENIVIFFNPLRYENRSLQSTLASFKSVLRHELMHLAQNFFEDFLKSQNKNISPFKEKYKQDVSIEDYVTDNSELQPLIVTQFYEFVEQNKNAKYTIEEWLYSAKVFINGNTFFKKLFVLNKKLFNSAVKKFFEMINDKNIASYKKDYLVPNIGKDEEKTYSYLEEQYLHHPKKHNSEEELLESQASILSKKTMKLSKRTFLKKANDAHNKQVALMKFLSKTAIELGAAEHIYVVGGAVRDFIIGHPIKDVDVVIDAVALKGKDSAWFAKKLQEKIPTKTSLATNNYGVAILSIQGFFEFENIDLNGEVIEIANARKESYGGAEGKAYKPSEVNVTNIEEDVFRREFTFNTLMWKLSQLANGPDKAEIIDLTGCGLKDLKNGEMACPSDPDKTFSDDPTRMLRAIKFLVRYGWKINADVKSAILRNARKLKDVPYEAVFNILIGNILKDSTYKTALVAMKELGLLDVVSEMIAENKEMANALSHWANDKKVKFLLDLMEEGVPAITRFNFLSEDQQKKFKDLVPTIEEPEALLEALKQPGKVIDMPFLMKELNLKGKQVQTITNVARDIALDIPEIINDSEKFTAVILKKLKGELEVKTSNRKFLSKRAGEASKKKPSAKKDIKDEERDVDQFYKRLFAVVQKRGLSISTLGYLGDYPLVLVKANPMKPGPRLLIAAGFHGEEPAGSWGLLEFLESAEQRYFDSANLSFLPMVNPTGIKAGRRVNDWDENPNRGFCHTNSDQTEPSREGKFLLENLSHLTALGRDGFISLHEDIDCFKFYIYTFERSEEPGEFSEALRQVESRFFAPKPDGKREPDDKRDDDIIVKGVIFKKCDGSFEDRLFHEGVPRTACTETPGKRSFDIRVKANCNIAQEFVEFHLKTIEPNEESEFSFAALKEFLPKIAKKGNNMTNNSKEIEESMADLLSKEDLNEEYDYSKDSMEAVEMQKKDEAYFDYMDKVYYLADLKKEDNEELPFHECIDWAKKHLEEKGILQPEKNPLTFASLINYADHFDKIGEIGKANTIDRILKNF